MDEQSKNQTSTDPSTVSPPPVEGRTDIGEGQADSEQQAANATTAPTDELLSKPPTEGRVDVAQDTSQEQEQSYSASTSASTDQVPDPPSTGDTARTAPAQQGRAPQSED